MNKTILVLFLLSSSYSFSQNCEAINKMSYYKGIGLGYPLDISLKDDFKKGAQSKDTILYGIWRLSFVENEAKFKKYNEMCQWGNYFNWIYILTGGWNESIISYWFQTSRDVKSKEEAEQMGFDFMSDVITDLKKKFGSVKNYHGFDANGKRYEYAIWECNMIKIRLQQEYTDKNWLCFLKITSAK